MARAGRLAASLALGLALIAASLPVATAQPDPRAAEVPARARERDVLRSRQVVAPSTSRISTFKPSSSSAIPAAEPVPASFVGFAVADVTVGSGSTLQKAQQSGAGWMLGWISWQQLEPIEGQYAWTQQTNNDIDKLIQASQSSGLQALARLQTVPAWATTDGTTRLAAVRPQALRSFGHALSSHAAGRVSGYQVFNEPNLNFEWGRCHELRATTSTGCVPHA